MRRACNRPISFGSSSGLLGLLVVGAFLSLSRTEARADDAKPSPDAVAFFESRIRPLLVKHCYECHSAESKELQGGLRLDTRAGTLAGGHLGPAVVPGKPDDSPLIEAVRYRDKDFQMPPKGKLSAAEIGDFEKWVKEGAVDPRTDAKASPGGAAKGQDHWAFQPVKKPELPDVRQKDWPVASIDRFVLARQEAKKIAPMGEADRRTLIRRATFDLIGLPPTPGEIAAFEADDSPDALGRLVDRLLASPAYGERWGRHWLDVVRYADTAGDNSDYPIPQMYRYRNWVIDALNRDMPYDEFVRQQLAGDLMPAANDRERREKIVATGYLANAKRFGSYEDKRYPWHLTIEDTIDNLGRTYLGLTINCARCHDHKFDPLSSEDYYALYGFFNSTRYPWPGIELEKRQRDLTPLGGDAGLAYAVADSDKLGKRRVGNVSIQIKGDPERPGREAARRFPTILGGQTLAKETAGSGRAQLAGWLVDPANPLVGRVMVNRLWHYHFGRGIVATPSDFGKQGQPPTHPELLDYLATRFVDAGWSIKKMHRELMLSRTYQLATTGDDAALAKAAAVDADNDLVWRFRRRRLDAESIRDALLAVSGGLDRSRGGAHPFPAEKTWGFTQHNPFKAVYDTDRRSVYLMTQRIQRHPFLALFDGADTNASTDRRTTSTTALQALYLLNDPFVHEQSRRLAKRLIASERDEVKRIDQVYPLLYGRPAAEVDRTAARDYLGQVRETLAAQKFSESERETKSWESLLRALFLSNEFVYVN